MLRIAFSFLLALTLVHPAQVAAQATAPSPTPRTIDVSGHGDVNAKPDVLIVAFTVTSEAQTADKCTELQAASTRKLVDALKAKIGDQGKVETANFSLNPNYTSVASTPGPAAAPKHGEWKFTSRVIARTDRLEIVGRLIEVAMAAGALRMGASGFDESAGDGGVIFGQFRAGGPSTFLSRAPAVPPASATGAGQTPAPTKRLASVTMEVEAVGATPDECVREGSRVSDAVVKALRDKLGNQGSADIAEFSVLQVPPEQLQQFNPPPTYSQKQTSFSARTTVTADTHHLDLLGDLIQTGLTNGAQQLESVSFSLRDDAKARREAIAKASEDARTKAATVASSMGVKLGKILRISTNAAVRPQVLYGNSFQGGSSAGVGLSSFHATAMPVLPREVGLSADVNVQYEIQ